MRDLFLKQSHGVVLMYSVSDRGTFLAIPDCVTLLQNIKDSDTTPMVLVGNMRETMVEVSAEVEKALISHTKERICMCKLHMHSRNIGSRYMNKETRIRK